MGKRAAVIMPQTRKILEQMGEQIRLARLRRKLSLELVAERAGISRYRESLRRDLRRRFSPRNYYLTEDGLVFFYPMYAIAPAREGIPAFTLPYGEDILFPPEAPAPSSGT